MTENSQLASLCPNLCCFPLHVPQQGIILSHWLNRTGFLRSLCWNRRIGWVLLSLEVMNVLWWHCQPQGTCWSLPPPVHPERFPRGSPGVAAQAGSTDSPFMLPGCVRTHKCFCPDHILLPSKCSHSFNGSQEMTFSFIYSMLIKEPGIRNHRKRPSNQAV